MAKSISHLKYKQIADLSYQMVVNAGMLQAPVNVQRIVELCGVTLEEADLGDEISGLLVSHGDNARIAFSSNQGEQRKRFTIAHELGHFLLHKESDGSDTVFVDKDFIVKYRSNKLYSESELRQEQEANAFAASLLMPKEFIFDELNKERNKSLGESELINELASVFEVSIPAMTFRLSNLNILY